MTQTAAILLSLATSMNVANAFVPNSVPGKRIPVSAWRRSQPQFRRSSIQGFFISVKGATIDNILEDVDGIGEASNPEDVNSDQFSNASGDVPPPLLDLVDNNDIADILASTLSSPETIGSEILSGDSMEADVLVTHGQNNIVQGPNSVSRRPLELAEQEEEEDIETPGVLKIMKFAVPAVGVWLCGPLLSLIDTSTVGLLSGTAQQAALSPAVAVADYSALLLAFMYTATTNLISAAQETDRGVEGKPRTTRTLISSLQLSGYVGSAIGASLIVLARVALRAIIGNDTIDPEVFSAAMKYLRIRALGMPAAAIIGSAQSACLGMKDIKSPLYVLLAAAVVNFFCDMVFVRSSHPFIGGAAGAAWATTLSQYAALFMFMKWLQNKPKNAVEVPTALPTDDSEHAPVKKINLTNAIMELTGPSSSPGASRRRDFREKLRSLRMSRACSLDRLTSKSSTGGSVISNLVSMMKRSKGTSSSIEGQKSSDDSYSSRGFLEGKMRFRDVLSFPNKEAAMEFWPYVLPVTATSIGRVSGYVAMSHVVSSSIGTIAMAAQQIVLSFFYCLCPLADSLNLTAQSFVPTLFEKKKSVQRTEALKRISKEFWRAGLLMGSVCVGAVSLIPILSRFFTGDPSVIFEVNSAAPFLATFFAVHGLFSASEGILLGQKDLGFLGKTYAAFFFAVPWFMLRVKEAALSGVENVGLTSVWKVFVGYQLFRTVSWLVRIGRLNRKSEKEAIGSDGGFSNALQSSI